MINLNEDTEAYRLCGIIYFGDFHFTSRIIEADGKTWYNDGVELGRRSKFQGNIDNMDAAKLSRAKKRKSSVAIYTKL